MSSVNVDALFQHLMEDPDIIAPEGQRKEDIALAMAEQRARQSRNNEKALNMVKMDSNVDLLIDFLSKAKRKFTGTWDDHKDEFHEDLEEFAAFWEKNLDELNEMASIGDMYDDEEEAGHHVDSMRDMYMAFKNKWANFRDGIDNNEYFDADELFNFDDMEKWASGAGTVNQSRRVMGNANILNGIDDKLNLSTIDGLKKKPTTSRINDDAAKIFQAREERRQKQKEQRIAASTATNPESEKAPEETKTPESESSIQSALDTFNRVGEKIDDYKETENPVSINDMHSYVSAFNQLGNLSEADMSSEIESALQRHEGRRSSISAIKNYHVEAGEIATDQEFGLDEPVVRTDDADSESMNPGKTDAQKDAIDAVVSTGTVPEEHAEAWDEFMATAKDDEIAAVQQAAKDGSFPEPTSGEDKLSALNQANTKEDKDEEASRFDTPRGDEQSVDERVAETDMLQALVENGNKVSALDSKQKAVYFKYQDNLKAARAEGGMAASIANANHEDFLARVQTFKDGSTEPPEVTPVKEGDEPTVDRNGHDSNSPFHEDKFYGVDTNSSTHELPSFIDHPDLQDSDGKPVSSGEKLRRMYEEAVGKHMGRDITREEISDLQNLPEDQLSEEQLADKAKLTAFDKTLREKNNINNAINTGKIKDKIVTPWIKAHEKDDGYVYHKDQSSGEGEANTSFENAQEKFRGADGAPRDTKKWSEEDRNAYNRLQDGLKDIDRRANAGFAHRTRDLVPETAEEFIPEEDYDKAVYDYMMANIDEFNDIVTRNYPRDKKTGRHYHEIKPETVLEPEPPVGKTPPIDEKVIQEVNRGVGEGDKDKVEDAITDASNAVQEDKDDDTVGAVNSASAVGSLNNYVEKINASSPDININPEDVVPTAEEVATTSVSNKLDDYNNGDASIKELEEHIANTLEEGHVDADGINPIIESVQPLLSARQHLKDNDIDPDERDESGMPRYGDIQTVDDAEKHVQGVKAEKEAAETTSESEQESTQEDDTDTDTETESESEGGETGTTGRQPLGDGADDSGAVQGRFDFGDDDTTEATDDQPERPEPQGIGGRPGRSSEEIGERPVEPAEAPRGIDPRRPGRSPEDIPSKAPDIRFPDDFGVDPDAQMPERVGTLEGPQTQEVEGETLPLPEEGTPEREELLDADRQRVEQREAAAKATAEMNRRKEWLQQRNFDSEGLTDKAINSKYDGMRLKEKDAHAAALTHFQANGIDTDSAEFNEKFRDANGDLHHYVNLDHAKQHIEGVTKDGHLRSIATKDGVFDEDRFNELQAEHENSTSKETKKALDTHRTNEANQAFSEHKAIRNAELLNMNELHDNPSREEVENRVRQLAKFDQEHALEQKKNNKNKMLDSNHEKHLRGLLADAGVKYVNGGGSEEEIQEIQDKISAEIDEHGENFYTGEHKAALDEEYSNHARHKEWLHGEDSHGQRADAFSRSAGDQFHTGKEADPDDSELMQDVDRRQAHQNFGGGEGQTFRQSNEFTKHDHPPTIHGADEELQEAQKTHHDLMHELHDHVSDHQFHSKKADRHKAGIKSPNDFDSLEEARSRGRANYAASDRDDKIQKMKALEEKHPQLADANYKAEALGHKLHDTASTTDEHLGHLGITGEGGLDKEALRLKQGLPPGPPPRPGLVWAKGIHKWVKPETLKGLMGQVAPGGGMYMPNGLPKDHPDDEHSGPVMVTANGVHSVNPGGGSSNVGDVPSAKDNVANILGAGMQPHHDSGGPLADQIHVDKEAMDAMGANGATVNAATGGLSTPENDPATYGKGGSASQRTLDRAGTKKSATHRLLNYIGRGLVEAAGELSGPLEPVGQMVRNTGKHKEIMTNYAMDRVDKRRSAESKTSALVDHLTERRKNPNYYGGKELEGLQRSERKYRTKLKRQTQKGNPDLMARYKRRKKAKGF